MDPVMELATVVASYLWSWRDADSTLTVVPKSDKVNAATLAQRLAETLQHDHAMLQRLLELTQRAPTESWFAKSETGWIAADFEDVMKDVASRDAKGILAAIGTRAREFQKYKPGQEISHKVCLAMVESYAKHVEQLALYFARTRLRARSSRRPITRERLTTYIAKRLLKYRIASKVAAAIDYCPMLLRDIPRRAAALDDTKYPSRLLAHCKKMDIPIPFPFVLERELVEVRESRKRRFHDVSPPKSSRSDEQATAGGVGKSDVANDAALPGDDHPGPNGGSRRGIL